MTYTTDNGMDAPPVALVAGVLQMSAVVKICIRIVGQAGTMTPEYVAWWQVLRQSDVYEVHCLIHVCIIGKMHELAHDDTFATQRSSSFTKFRRSDRIRGGGLRPRSFSPMCRKITSGRCLRTSSIICCVACGGHRQAPPLNTQWTSTPSGSRFVCPVLRMKSLRRRMYECPTRTTRIKSSRPAVACAPPRAALNCAIAASIEYLHNTQVIF